MVCVVPMKFRWAFAAALLFCAATPRSHGDLFAWTYTTDLEEKGEFEFEQWLTARWGKEHGNYSVIDLREEVEYGLTDNFQIALYLNHRYTYANNDVPAENPTHPENRLLGVYKTGGEDVPASHNPTRPFDRYKVDSVSLEGIYRLLNPKERPVGLAVYFEPTIGDDERELEWKLILQENWLGDRFVWALNMNYDLEFEKAENGYEYDGIFQWFTGISYRLHRKWSAGLEFWNHHEFADATVHEHSAYFMGPTIHHAHEHWWATLGFVHQLPICQAFSHENKQFAAHDGYIFGDEHEKYYVRLRVGLEF
jgi:uncharacterized protein DUF6662